jgi:predicted metal-dependent hydrolase
MNSYRVVYSRRRNVRLTVERDGQLIVRAPEGTSREVIESIVAAKKRWIAQKASHPQKYQPRAHAPGKELVSGETMLYLGRNFRIDVVDVASREISFNQRFYVPRELARRDGRERFREWYVARAQDRLVPRTYDWAQKVGVVPKKVVVADLTFRWGSCTAAEVIRLNWRLIKAPVPVSDYVIVHELAHLLESSHGPRFWSIVRSQVAHIETARDWLRQHGQLLEADL